MPSRAPAADIRTFLRRLPLALAGAVVLWALARPIYAHALCAATQFLARVAEVPPASAVVLQGDDALLGRTDMRADSGWLKVPLVQIHFNLVPFLALALALPRPLAGGGWRRLLLALAVLAASHVLALLFQLKFLEAFSMGPWSQANYSDLARNVYGTLRYFFDIPVTFALPLLLWIGTYPQQVFALVGLGAPVRR
ncbi:MAG TPA: hypothetical protein VMT45_06875 [Thermoanaerobaculaceae bacterium]|nr:hypothetical protein [Thermoanaerobaculaceae bacterium]